MTSSSRDPAAIPTRRDLLPYHVVLAVGFVFAFAAGLAVAVHLVVTAWLGGTS